MKISKCLKEWNATIEALGHGKQTILIRRYNTNVNKFLLYPTSGYASKYGYINGFQDKYQKFVEKNELPEIEDKNVLIKYYANLEKIIEIRANQIPEDYFIWTKEHVKSYLSRKKGFVWVLRVYKLKKPYWAKPSFGAIKFVNLEDEISLDGMEPVLNDSEFRRILSNLKDLSSKQDADN